METRATGRSEHLNKCKVYRVYRVYKHKVDDGPGWRAELQVEVPQRLGDIRDGIEQLQASTVSQEVRTSIACVSKHK